MFQNPGPGEYTIKLIAEEGVYDAVEKTFTVADENVVVDFTLTYTAPTEQLTGELSFTAARGGAVTASLTGGNSGNAGSLTYTWSGEGVTQPGFKNATLPWSLYERGKEITVTVTGTGYLGSVSKSTTVFQVNIDGNVVGDGYYDDAYIGGSNYGIEGDKVTINYILGDSTGKLTLKYVKGAEIAVVEEPGEGSVDITIDPANADGNGVIEISATFES
jgi:hypothetical protein